MPSPTPPQALTDAAQAGLRFRLTAAADTTLTPDEARALLAERDRLAAERDEVERWALCLYCAAKVPVDPTDTAASYQRLLDHDATCERNPHRQRAEAAEARAAALAGALEQYGHHTLVCQQQSVHVCACGLDALLAPPPAAAGPADGGRGARREETTTT